MNNITNKSTARLVTAALFTAFIAVCSQISVPLPSQISLTLQTLAVALCGYTVGIKWGLASVAAYILSGAVGIPVFSCFKGGIHVLFGASGGFVIGFIPLAVLCGTAKSIKNKPLKLLIGILGLAVCHIIGILRFSSVYGTDIFTSFITVSALYIIKDIASVTAALFLSLYLKKRIKI